MRVHSAELHRLLTELHFLPAAMKTNDIYRQLCQQSLQFQIPCCSHEFKLSLFYHCEKTATCSASDQLMIMTTDY